MLNITQTAIVKIFKGDRVGVHSVGPSIDTTNGGVIALALQLSAEMRSLPMNSLACQVVVANSPGAELSRIPGCCFIMCERKCVCR